MKSLILAILVAIPLMGAIHCNRQSETEAVVGPLTYIKVYTASGEYATFKSTFKEPIRCKYSSEITVAAGGGSQKKFCFLDLDNLRHEIWISNMTTIILWEE